MSKISVWGVNREFDSYSQQAKNLMDVWEGPIYVVDISGIGASSEVQECLRRTEETLNRLREEQSVPLLELEKLYKLQMQRIETERANEAKTGKLQPSLTNEIFVAHNLLLSIAEIKGALRNKEVQAIQQVQENPLDLDMTKATPGEAS